MGESGGFERVSDLVPRGEGGDTGDTVINTPAKGQLLHFRG